MVQRHARFKHDLMLQTVKILCSQVAQFGSNAFVENE